MQGFVTVLAMLLSTTGLVVTTVSQRSYGWCLTGAMDAPPTLAERLDDLPAALGLPSVNELFGLTLHKPQSGEPVNPETRERKGV